MNLLLGLFLTIGSVVGSILLIKHNIEKTINMSFGGVNLPQLLSSDPSSLVKFLNNKPVPGDTTNGSAPTTGEGTVNGMGTGGRPNIRFNSNINNMTADNLQMGEIVNKRVKAKTINQGINSAITNKVRRGTFNMGNGVVNVAGERPGVKLNAATSNMVLTGDVRRLRAPGASSFRTQHLRITGVVTGGIMASKYVRKDKSKNYLASGEGFDTEFSKKELKEIEKQARVRIAKNQKLTDEERKEAIEKEKERLIQQRLEENGRKELSEKELEAIEEQAKDNISKRGLLTEDEYKKALEEEMENIKQERLDRRRQIFMQNNMSSEGVNADPMLVSQNNVAVVLNEARIINGYKIEEQKHTYLSANPNSSVTIVGLKQVYLNPENHDLKYEEKVKLYVLDRIYKTEQIIAGGLDNTTPYSIESGSTTSNNYEEVFSLIVREVPELNPPEMMEVAKMVEQMRYGRIRTDQLLARTLTDSKMNLKEADKTSLDTLLEQTSTVANNFNAYIEDNFKDDNIHTLSEAELEEIKQKAKENVEKREDISLEDKERELEEEIQKLEEEKKEKYRKEAEDRVKEEILQDPEQAKRVLGEEGAELLKEERSNNRKKQDDYYTQILKRNSDNKDDKFRIQNIDEYEAANRFEVHEDRVKSETREDIRKAARELYGDNSSNNANMGQTQTSQGNSNAQEEPQVKEVVYISPQAQEYIARIANRQNGLNEAEKRKNRTNESFSNNLEYANVLSSAENQDE